MLCIRQKLSIQIIHFPINLLQCSGTNDTIKIQQILLQYNARFIQFKTQREDKLRWQNILGNYYGIHSGRQTMCLSITESPNQAFNQF